ncbi:unknown protein [Parachlamydia acanthamoebae UV-7]|uniref:Transposase DDE domain-containing protein n=1 Tax=Parachlamydia acanthamoebae (strain UV7) TaxID=765952 RepID=F8KX05_PARAV|nr:unknown protein [Parachlamydia acanthamoebae UV-7]
MVLRTKSYCNCFSGWLSFESDTLSGSEHDSVPFKVMTRNLPKGSEIYGDSAYLDYEHQDMLEEVEKIRLIAQPKSNSIRPISLHDFVNLKYIRHLSKLNF